MDEWETLHVKLGDDVYIMKNDKLIHNLFLKGVLFTNKTLLNYYKIQIPSKISSDNPWNTYIVKIKDRLWMLYNCVIGKWTQYDKVYFDDFKFDKNNYLMIHTISYEEMQSQMTA